MKKFILYVILSFISANAYPEDIDNTALHHYVNDLVNDGLNILNDKNLSQELKIIKTKELIINNLDLTWMAKFTLGNYRKTLAPEQIKQFIEIYSRYVSKAYADLVKNYKGQQAEVKQIRAIDKGQFMVTMSINNIKVEYLVHQVNYNNASNLKVSDVITEGVSLITSQQAEFMNILSSSGFDNLIKELAKKS
jgi:phospholipid transport system substrate-binding protein